MKIKLLTGTNSLTVINRKIVSFLVACSFLTFLSTDIYAQAQASVKSKPLPPPSPVSVGAGGRMVYSSDAFGNRIPDFSYCGYKASEQAIPNVPVRVVVPVGKGDATLRIQSALDYVGSLPVDKNGF